MVYYTHEYLYKQESVWMTGKNRFKIYQVQLLSTSTIHHAVYFEFYQLHIDVEGSILWWIYFKLNKLIINTATIYNDMYIWMHVLITYNVFVDCMIWQRWIWSKKYAFSLTSNNSVKIDCTTIMLIILKDDHDDVDCAK